MAEASTGRQFFLTWFRKRTRLLLLLIRAKVTRYGAAALRRSTGDEVYELVRPAQLRRADPDCR